MLHHIPERSCHNSGGYSLDFYFGSLGSLPRSFMWDLWYTKWHTDRFLSECFSFPLLV